MADDDTWIVTHPPFKTAEEFLVEVDPSRVVPAARVLLDVTGFSVPSEKPAHAGLSDAEQRRCRNIPLFPDRNAFTKRRFRSSE